MTVCIDPDKDIKPMVDIVYNLALELREDGEVHVYPQSKIARLILQTWAEIEGRKP
jgi:hypothetical protein